MNSPLNLINKRFNHLSKSEKTVAEFVQKHIDEVVLLTTQGIAERCKTSDATVIRFCRSIGYQTFNEFKTALVPELLRSGKSLIKEVEQSSNTESTTQAFLYNLKQQIDFTINNLEADTLKIIADKIIKSNRMIIVGIGGAAGVGYIFNDSLCVLGIYSSYISDRSIIQNIIPTLNSKDVVFAISHSGETNEIVSALKAANEYDLVTIALTNFLSSPLTQYAKYVLHTSVPDNLLGSFSCQSRISQLALLELILQEIKNKLSKRKK
ncbi:MAG: MurR/RpiR family transcriptional regulator [Ignavibacteriales bacterium]|nr:MurR/RpiR family transcriptional regulator [Ignavibacteriales bacterium]MCB9260012.1 MurR/RpiR family transcriptional regulator [Ignavibacteriales bacterium]